MIELKESIGVRPPRPSASRPLVIVVDDEPWILSAIRRVLRNEPYDVMTTLQPEEALDWIRQGDVSVVLTDQRMPGMTGTELLDLVRKSSPSTGCILLTGHPGGTVIIKGFTVGVDRLLNKPWDDNVLRGTVRQLIRDWGIDPLRKRLEDS